MGAIKPNSATLEKKIWVLEEVTENAPPGSHSATSPGSIDHTSSRAQWPPNFGSPNSKRYHRKPGPWKPEHPAQREDLAKSDSLWEETNLTGIWAGTTTLFIDGKLFARVRALWGPLKMFGRPQSQKLCVLRKGLWASRKFSSQKAPSPEAD